MAARLYAEQGIDAQALLGHKSPDMTALYRDVRGSEWIEIRFGLMPLIGQILNGYKNITINQRVTPKQGQMSPAHRALWGK